MLGDTRVFYSDESKLIRDMYNLISEITFGDPFDIA